MSGLTCAVGAMAAHASAGGEVGVVPALLTTLASVALGVGVLRTRVDPLLTVALSLLAQLTWHTVLVASAPPVHHHGAGPMLTHHLVAAAVAACVALGAEQQLGSAWRWLLARLQRTLPVPGVPVSVRPAPPTRGTDRTLHGRLAVDPAHPHRGPPEPLPQR